MGCRGFLGQHPNTGLDGPLPAGVSPAGEGVGQLPWPPPPNARSSPSPLYQELPLPQCRELPLPQCRHPPRHDHKVSGPWWVDRAQRWPVPSRWGQNQSRVLRPGDHELQRGEAAGSPRTGTRESLHATHVCRGQTRPGTEAGTPRAVPGAWKEAPGDRQGDPGTGTSLGALTCRTRRRPPPPGSFQNVSCLPSLVPPAVPGLLASPS